MNFAPYQALADALLPLLPNSGDGAHDLAHLQRVWVSARAIAAIEGGDADVLAAAVLHHLRDEADWEQAFQKLHRITAPGGSVWITDLTEHSAIRRR